MTKKTTAPALIEALNIKRAKSKPLDNYTKQKQKILEYSPKDRKQKQVKTLAVYCLKIRQLRADNKKLYFNPLLVEIANSPDIIRALENTPPAKFKEIRKAVINSSLRGKEQNRKQKQAILNSINGRPRLYRDYTDKKNSRTREKVKTNSPELKTIRTYNSNKRAEKVVEDIREKVEQPATFKSIKKAVILYIKSRKQSDTRTTASEFLRAYETAEKIIQQMETATRPELSKVIRARTIEKAEARNIAEQKKTARKWYTREKRNNRPPLFSRNPIENSNLTRTATEIHREKLKRDRQQKAINMAVFNVKYSADADKLRVHREQQRKALKLKAFEMIAGKIEKSKK